MNDSLTRLWVRLISGDRAGLRLDIHLGPVHLFAQGRAVFFMWVTIVLLAAAGIAVLLSGQAELRRRWTTWALVAPVVGIPIWLGPGPTALLAAALAVQSVREYTPLVALPRPERAVLLGFAVGYPAGAWLAPSLLALAPVLALLCALPALLAGDSEVGLRRASTAAFGSIWICWSLAHLVVLGDDAFLVCFAAAAADVAAWCGGRGLRRFEWARRPLSPLSPNTTIGTGRRRRRHAGGVAGAWHHLRRPRRRGGPGRSRRRPARVDGQAAGEGQGRGAGGFPASAVCSIASTPCSSCCRSRRCSDD